MATLFEAFTTIANSIRKLNGKSNTMTPAQMGESIEAFSEELTTVTDTQTDLINDIMSALEGKSATGYPALSNPGTSEDLAKGRELIDQNGNVIAGTHVCETVTYPKLTTPGTAGHLAEGYELIDQNGNVVKGTHVCEELSYPTLSNPASADKIESGYQLIDQHGNVVTGTHVCKSGSEIVTINNITDGRASVFFDPNGFLTVVINDSRVTSLNQIKNLYISGSYKSNGTSYGMGVGGIILYNGVYYTQGLGADAIADYHEPIQMRMTYYGETTYGKCTIQIASKPIIGSSSNYKATLDTDGLWFCIDYTV